MDFYRRAFGPEPADRLDFGGFTLVYLRSPDLSFELELTIITIAGSLYTLGDGYGHIAVLVADLESEHKRLDREGLRPGPIREMTHAGAPLARFFFMQDPDCSRSKCCSGSGDIFDGAGRPPTVAYGPRDFTRVMRESMRGPTAHSIAVTSPARPRFQISTISVASRA